MSGVINLISVPIGIVGDALLKKEIPAAALLPTIQKWKSNLKLVKDWAVSYTIKDQTAVCDFLAQWDAVNLYDSIMQQKEQYYFILIEPKFIVSINQNNSYLYFAVAKVDGQIHIFYFAIVWELFRAYYADYLDKTREKAAFLPNPYMSETEFQHKSLTSIILPLFVKENI